MAVSEAIFGNPIGYERHSLDFSSTDLQNSLKGPSIGWLDALAKKSVQDEGGLTWTSLSQVSKTGTVNMHTVNNHPILVSLNSFILVISACVYIYVCKSKLLYRCINWINHIIYKPVYGEYVHIFRVVSNRSMCFNARTFQWYISSDIPNCTFHPGSLPLLILFRLWFFLSMMPGSSESSSLLVVGISEKNK